MTIPWHKVAAAMLIARFPLSLALISPTLRGDLGVLILLAAVHAVLAIGYLARNPIVIWFGIYGAALGLLTPFLYGRALSGPAGMGPWLIVNTVFSAVLLGVTIATWRQKRAQAT